LVGVLFPGSSIMSWPMMLPEEMPAAIAARIAARPLEPVLLGSSNVSILFFQSWISKFPSLPMYWECCPPAMMIFMVLLWAMQ
jgi:hypothetical protein